MTVPRLPRAVQGGNEPSPSALGQQVSSEALEAEMPVIARGTKPWVLLASDSLARALCHLHHSLSYAVPQLLVFPCRLQTPISLPDLALSLLFPSSHWCLSTLMLCSLKHRDGLISPSFRMASCTTALHFQCHSFLLMSRFHLPSCPVW